jgi:LmbE family N-acetylglucosaminyl deacetylase
MGNQDNHPGTWESHQKVLVVLAHPDDPEFFCGATIYKWVQAGHEVHYCLITCGDKGTSDVTLSPDELCAIRQREQRAAARVLGVEDVKFLGYPDGYLIADINLRRDLTRVIRTIKPDILITCDPQTLFTITGGLNHPDHRAAGQAALEAVYPSARDHLYFIELWNEENLEPHVVREVWVCGTLQPNVILDVTEFWETKIQALYEHKSQIGDPEKLADRMRNRRSNESTAENPRYEERFRRIVLG